MLICSRCKCNALSDEHGLMRLRIASINDLPIKESDRKYHWTFGPRPDDHPGLTALGLSRRINP